MRRNKEFWETGRKSELNTTRSGTDNWGRPKCTPWEGKCRVQGRTWTNGIWHYKHGWETSSGNNTSVGPQCSKYYFQEEGRTPDNLQEWKSCIVKLTTF